MKKIALVLLLLTIIAVISAGCSSQPAAGTGFPPPSGYSSWEEYNSKASNTTTAATVTVSTPVVIPTTITVTTSVPVTSSSVSTVTTTAITTTTVTAAVTPTMAVSAYTEVEYLEYVAVLLQDLGDALMALGTLLETPYLTDSAWAESATEQINIIKSIYVKAIFIEPPVSLRYMHRAFIISLNYYNNGIQQIKEGISAANMQYILDSDTNMTYGNNHLEDFGNQIESLGQ